jgi:predicted GNAT family acetyltransferase
MLPFVPIRYQIGLDGIRGEELKRVLTADAFDNGRTPEQYDESCRNSALCVFAFDEDRLVGMARALSDGVCNAYVVDVWTQTEYRRQGIARAILEIIEGSMPGQHIALFTDDAPEFYAACGFRERGVTFEKVSGQWLMG